jgi:hypothetical protein
MVYCEEAVCGWIKTPANTWSNLAFVIAGVWIWRQSPAPALRVFPLACGFLGLVSGLFHASGVFVFQVADNIGMFVVPALGAALCLRRLGSITPERVPSVAAAIVGLFTLLMVGLSKTSIPTPTSMALLVVSLFVLEIRARRPQVSYRGFWSAIALLLASFTIWLLDYKRILCDPGNHWLQGHALWHLGTAAALPALYCYYRQFEAD